jgi:hypothetical protein
MTMNNAERALSAKVTVGEAVAYLRRVGLHEAAERMSLDRQIIVLGARCTPDDPCHTTCWGGFGRCTADERREEVA